LRSGGGFGASVCGFGASGAGAAGEDGPDAGASVDGAFTTSGCEDGTACGDSGDASVVGASEFDNGLVIDKCASFGND